MGFISGSPLKLTTELLGRQSDASTSTTCEKRNAFASHARSLVRVAAGALEEWTRHTDVRGMLEELKEVWEAALRLSCSRMGGLVLAPPHLKPSVQITAVCELRDLEQQDSDNGSSDEARCNEVPVRIAFSHVEGV